MAESPVPVRPKLQVGMVDTHVNETVTHVAELDEEAAKKQLKGTSIMTFLPALVIAIICPCVLLPFCLFYYSEKKAHEACVQQWQVYLTDQTLVYVDPTQPTEYHNKVAVPLTNIESVAVKLSDLMVTIKSSAPGVVVTRRDPEGLNTVTTHSLSIKCVKDTEDFANMLRERIK